jgi:regulator of sirC expression with transglutaminase-like and TPR domain
MARAAAKRRQPVRHHETDRRRHKDSGGQRFEDTLFFNRLRKQAKWVFVLLALTFGLTFVLFGVGSNVGAGLSDIFQGIRGNGSGQPSLKKAEQAAQQHPKSPQAWRDLATAYETQGDLAGAISAWVTYTSLRPKDSEGWTQLATDYSQQFNNQTAEAQAAQIDAQTAQASNFGPPPTSPLGKALTNIPDPIGQAVSGNAGQRFNQALSARQETATKRVEAYAQVAKLQPTEPAAQLQLADAAKDAGNTAVAVTAYATFIKLAPDDNQVPYAKQQIKSLQSQLTSSAQG